MTTTYTYTAYTHNNDGVVQEHTGTLEGARRKALKYAREGFGHEIAGYGPTIVIADKATGEIVLKQQL